MLDKLAEPVTIDCEVAFPRVWLTWVGATTACLQCLGVEADLVDVAGMSGYAFLVCVREELSPSAPTAVEWARLEHGVRLLGRSVQRFSSGECPAEPDHDRREAHCWCAFKIARREVEANRPCVLYGAYGPEFAIVYGVKGESYLVRSFRELRGEDQPPVTYDELQNPGGTYVLAFPTPTSFEQPVADRYALANAVRMFRRESFGSPCKFGVDAYELWMEELQQRRARVLGNSYNAHCYAEGRRWAFEFLRRVAERNPSRADQLGLAIEAYGTAAAACARLTELFPYQALEGADETAVVADGDAIRSAVEALRVARDAESMAIEVLARIAAEDWPEI